MDEPVFDLRVRVQLGPHPLELVLNTTARRIALVGPSGAGKSTALRIIAGVQRHVDGRFAFEGRTWFDSAERSFVPPEQRRVGWVPQDALLFPHVNVRRNLAWANPRLDGAEGLVAALRIDHLLDRSPRHLSGGERQRVAIARALLCAPRLLLLDEPFASLDPDLRITVADVLLDHCERNRVAVILVSHESIAATRLVDRTFALGEQGFTEQPP